MSLYPYVETTWVRNIPKTVRSAQLFDKNYIEQNCGEYFAGVPRDEDTLQEIEDSTLIGLYILPNYESKTIFTKIQSWFRYFFQK